MEYFDVIKIKVEGNPQLHDCHHKGNGTGSWEVAIEMKNREEVNFEGTIYKTG